MAHKVRLRQEAIEVTFTPPTSGRVDQLIVEVAARPGPTAGLVMLVAAEVASAPDPPNSLVGQVAVEVLEEVLPCQ